jgi:hypothetical protein
MIGDMSDNLENLDKEIEAGLARANRMIQRRKRLRVMIGFATLVTLGLVVSGLILVLGQSASQTLITPTSLVVPTMTQTMDVIASATQTSTPTITPTATYSPTPTQTSIPAQHLFFLAVKESDKHSIFSLNLSTGELLEEAKLEINWENLGNTGISVTDRVSWTVDGQKVALLTRPSYSSSYKLYVWDRSENATSSFEFDAQYLFSPDLSWSSDGNYLAMMADSNLMYIFDIEKSATMIFRNDRSFGYSGIDWVPGSKSVVFHEWGNGLMRVSMSNLAYPELFMLYTSDVESFAISHNGSMIALSNNGRLLVYPARNDGADPISARKLSSLNSSRMMVADIVWSPDNQKIAVMLTTSDGFANGVAILSVDGSILMEKKYLFGRRGDALGISWSPDSQLLAYSMPNENGFGSKVYVSNLDGSSITVVSAGDDFTQNKFPGWGWK